jgi:hypothetical protein
MSANVIPVPPDTGSFASPPGFARLDNELKLSPKERAGACQDSGNHA